jgi:hypothetical protein
MSVKIWGQGGLFGKHLKHNTLKNNISCPTPSQKARLFCGIEGSLIATPLQILGYWQGMNWSGAG